MLFTSRGVCMCVPYQMKMSLDVNHPFCSFYTTAATAEGDGVKVFKFPRWRTKGQAIPEVVSQYKEVGAELNVMPFCSQFIPPDVIDHPKQGSIIYHPSILPRHRGASAINW